MAHELDFSTGQAAIALVGGAKSAWHGLGQEIKPTDSVETIQKKAGLNWDALASPLTYTDQHKNARNYDGQQVVYRSDTGAPLGVTSDHRYNIVQPKQIMEFFRDFLSTNKLSIETAGSVRGGRIIWCMAKLGKDYGFLMPGGDKIDGYVRLQTSFDGTRATDLVATTVRQVCANTMALVDVVADRQGHKVVHSAKFNAKALQHAFGLMGKQHKVTAEVWNAMIKKQVSAKDRDEFFCKIMGVDPKELGKTDRDGKKLVSTRTENVLKELAAAFAQGPGSSLKSAKGTAFGLLQAVTYWVDHKSSCQDNYEEGEATARRNSAWFGIGERTKQDAQHFAAELAGCEKLLQAA